MSLIALIIGVPREPTGVDDFVAVVRIGGIGRQHVDQAPDELRVTW